MRDALFEYIPIVCLKLIESAYINFSIYYIDNISFKVLFRRRLVTLKGRYKQTVATEHRTLNRQFWANGYAKSFTTRIFSDRNPQMLQQLARRTNDQP